MMTARTQHALTHGRFRIRRSKVYNTVFASCSLAPFPLEHHTFMAHSELLEAQLITSCLEAATDKLHVLALIRADGEQSDLLKMRSDETGRMLEQHSGLMTQLKENIDTRR